MSESSADGDAFSGGDGATAVPTPAPPPATSDGNRHINSSPRDVFVVPFCVSLPSMDGDRPSDSMGDKTVGGAGGGRGGGAAIKPLDLAAGPAGAGGKGAVGTVTFMGRSAMVWFGWGDLLDGGEVGCEAPETSGGGEVAVGSGLPIMGPLAVATPRTRYSGAFSEKEAPATQLVGAPSDEDMVAGMQIAARLAAKSGWPVYVSCSLHSDAAGMEGMGTGRVGTLSQRAAALAEREAGRILLWRREELEGR